MSKLLKKKYQIILAHELQMARSAAAQVIKPKPFSVWEVLIPIVFILGYMRSKEQREVFAENLLFTKKLALGAALDMAKNSLSKTRVLEKIDKETKNIIRDVDESIYSEDIRKNQMEEIDFLIDHFQRLLEADGDEFEALIVNTYKTKSNYALFLTRLKSAEGNVTSAACRTLRDKADTATLARLESTIDSLRLKEAENIFGADQPFDA